MCWCQRRRTTLEEEQGHNLQMVNVINIEWVCAQSCWTLCDPTDCSPPGSSVHGISQTRTLEWVAISSSRGSSRPRNQTHISCLLHWQVNSIPLCYQFNTAICYIQKLLRVNPKSSHNKEKFFSFCLILYEMMDVHWIYCGNHFKMYASQVVMLFTLNLPNAVCELHLNKAGRKR